MLQLPNDCNGVLDLLSIVGELALLQSVDRLVGRLWRGRAVLFARGKFYFHQEIVVLIVGPLQTVGKRAQVADFTLAAVVGWTLVVNVVLQVVLKGDLVLRLRLVSVQALLFLGARAAALVARRAQFIIP